MSPIASLPPGRRFLDWADLAVLGLLMALLYSVVAVAREWTGPLQAVAEIHTEARYLPLYAVFSLSRGVCAYGISLIFTLIYGFVMARVVGAERVLLPVLDILQSIPVLGFLPSFVIGLVHLFPHRNFGLEIASVLMIFTGQAWNMTFSFYASLKSVPPDLMAVARLSKLSWFQRFFQLDLSFAATGLVWNSMMSMAGGWFFLTVSEAFVLGDHDFRLPGLGSYMSLAIERGDVRSQALGVVAMLCMIVFFDQIVWRPVVAWSQKFTDEESGASQPSWVWERLRGARLWRAGRRSAGSVSAALIPALHSFSGCLISIWQPISSALPKLRTAILVLAAAGVLFGFSRYIHLLTTLTLPEWLHLFVCMSATFCRVLAAVALSTLWTVPVGVLIGRNPKWARIFQPLIQIAASFPAPMIFPLVVGGMLSLGIGLGVSSVLLLGLGAQWYVLFNVIAGTSAIPRELWEVASLGRFTSLTRWRKLILPALFPSLLTGWITATGGAWNASIVAEFMKYRGQTLAATGLGATISQATERGDFHVLAAAVGLMAIAVVGFNRLVWRPLSHLAQTRYAMNP